MLRAPLLDQLSSLIVPLSLFLSHFLCVCVSLSTSLSLYFYLYLSPTLFLPLPPSLSLFLPLPLSLTLFLSLSSSLPLLSRCLCFSLLKALYLFKLSLPLFHFPTSSIQQNNRNTRFLYYCSLTQFDGGSIEIFLPLKLDL